MWQGGPLRNFSPTRPRSSWIPLADGGYGGPYVCKGCQNDVIGLYQTSDGWMCSRCRGEAKFRRIEGKATA